MTVAIIIVAAIVVIAAMALAVSRARAHRLDQRREAAAEHRGQAQERGLQAARQRARADEQAAEAKQQRAAAEAQAARARQAEVRAQEQAARAGATTQEAATLGRRADELDPDTDSDNEGDHGNGRVTADEGRRSGGRLGREPAERGDPAAAGARGASQPAGGPSEQGRERQGS